MFSSYRSLLRHMRAIEFRDGENVSVEIAKLKQLISYILEKEPFDEEWYLSTYPDVKKALEKGNVKSAKHHYVETGYFEGRLPGVHGFEVDEYLRKNSDLAQMSSAEAMKHFIETGYSEGRPY
jgi:hypothetical protein